MPALLILAAYVLAFVHETEKDLDLVFVARWAHVPNNDHEFRAILVQPDTFMIQFCRRQRDL